MMQHIHIWKRLVVDIPPQYQTANMEITLKQNSDAASIYDEFGEQVESIAMDAANPNAYDSIAVAQVGLMGGVQPGVVWDGCYNYKITNLQQLILVQFQ